MTLEVRSLVCGDRDVCEMGGELIRLDVFSRTLIKFSGRQPEDGQ